MSENGSTTTGPIDYDVLDRIVERLASNERFSSVRRSPEYAPDSVVAEFDLGYFPTAVDRAFLQIRWYETGDFSIHYSEEREDGTQWECRWDRHPNGHNSRSHVHPPPSAATPGEDASFGSDWRDVLEQVLGELDDRIRAFWE